MTQAIQHPQVPMNPSTKFLKFDTHKYVNELKKSGLKENTATAIVKVLDETREFDMSQMASKGQLDRVALELKGQLDKLELEFKGQLDKLKLEFKGQLDKLKLEFKGQLDKLKLEFKGQLDRVNLELRGEIKEMKGQITQIMNMQRLIIGLISTAMLVVGYIIMMLLKKVGI